MKIQTINSLFFKNQCDGSWLYVSVLINIVVGYVLVKGYTVQVFVNNKNESEAVIFIEGIMVSLRSIFGWSDFEELDYYLNVFLHQQVAPNLEWDFKMTQTLGELYPRQYQKLLGPLVDSTETNLTIYSWFFLGIDLTCNQYLNSWAEREAKIKGWLQSITFDLSKQPPVYQKLYEAAVRSINEQPAAPYYVTRTGAYYVKLTKEQYIKVLGVYLSSGCFRKCVDYYVDILNLEIISFTFFTEEIHREIFHDVFPQVFSCFSLDHWSPAQNFYDDDLGLKIKKVYISKLWVKYYNYLIDSTKILQNFPTFLNLECTEGAMLNYWDSFEDDNLLESFLFQFLGYLRPLIKSIKEKGYY